MTHGGVEQVAFFYSGQGDAATKVLSDWIAKHPDDMVSIQQLADLNIASQHFDEAVKNLQLVLATKPHDPVALNNLAWVYQQQGDKRAEATAHEAYILSPGAVAKIVSTVRVRLSRPAARPPIHSAGFWFPVAMRRRV